MIFRILSIRFTPKRVIPDDAKQAIIKSNNVNFFSFIQRTFFRLFSFFLAIVLCFGVICKPKETNAAATGMVVLTTGEVISLVSTILGFAIPSVEWWVEQYKDYKNDSTATEKDVVDYFNEQITITGDGNYVISDDGMLTINAMKEEAEKEATYRYGYPVLSSNLYAGSFINPTQYKTVRAIIDNNPDYVFYLWRGNIGQIYILAWEYDEVSGMVCGDWSQDFFYGGMYNNDWKQMTMTGETGCYYMYCHTDVGIIKPDGTDLNIPYDEFDATTFDIAATAGKGVKNFGSIHHFALNDAKLSADTYIEIPPQMNWSYIYSAHPEAFPVFSTFDALKMGTVGQTGLQTVPGFYQPGPVTNNTVSKDQITEYNNVVNNYYGGGSGGSGSGSGNNNGGSSGGSWLDGILGFLGKIGDVIGAIVGKLLDILGDILKLFGDVFMDVIDIIPSGFVEFLTAMFPFVPKEWITIVSFGLILMLVGVIIRMFK